MIKIINYVLRLDRLKHFFIGTLVFIFIDISETSMNALILTSVLAVGKELYDKFVKKSKFDVLDILYTVLSGLIIVGIEIIRNQ